MHTSIIIKTTVLGVHCWPDAAKVMPEVSFLQNLHNHHFQITCKKRVYHDDRDVEILMFRKEVQDYLQRNFYDDNVKCLNFKNMSCEMICKDLQEAFNLDEVEVWEDSEVGAQLVMWMPLNGEVKSKLQL